MLSRKNKKPSENQAGNKMQDDASDELIDNLPEDLRSPAPNELSGELPNELSGELPNELSGELPNELPDGSLNNPSNEASGGDDLGDSIKDSSKVDLKKGLGNTSDISLPEPNLGSSENNSELDSVPENELEGSFEPIPAHELKSFIEDGYAALKKGDVSTAKDLYEKASRLQARVSDIREKETIEILNVFQIHLKKYEDRDKNRRSLQRIIRMFDPVCLTGEKIRIKKMSELAEKIYRDLPPEDQEAFREDVHDILAKANLFLSE